MNYPEIGNNVLDFASLVEASTGYQLVGCPVANECFLNHPGLGISPVHYCTVARCSLSLTYQALYFTDDELCLFLLGVRLNNRSAFASLVVCPEAHRFALLIG